MAEPRRIPSRDEISERLYAAWVAGPSREQADLLLDEIPVPGPVSLRGRFMLLTDPQGEYSHEAFALDWATWNRQLELTEAADAGLMAGDASAVNAATDALISTHQMGLHPLPIVDALIASGDLARQEEQPESALLLLDEARETAIAGGYRFGYLRATLSFGYVTLMKGSAEDALLLFSEAEALAGDLDDRVFRAGALTGMGEAHDRAGRPDEAISTLTEGIELFESIHSSAGVVNALLQLGDIYRRQRNTVASRDACQRAFDLAEVHGPWIATVSALDGIAEMDLAEGEFEAAAEHYREAGRRSLERGHVRGAAHGLNGFGRVMFAVGAPDQALEAHAEALKLFAAIDDHLSQSSTLTGMADAYEAAGDLASAMASRLASVSQIEQVRASQGRHKTQQEFVERFRRVYRAAFDTSALAQDAEGFTAVFEGRSGRRLAGLLDGQAGEAPQLEAQMLAFAETRQAPAEQSRAKRLAELLGRTALKAHLPKLVGDGIDDTAAALYTEFDPAAAAPLLERLNGTAVLAVCTMPGNPSEAIALDMQPGREAVIHRWLLPVETVELVAGIAIFGLPATATAADVAWLGPLLPPEWRQPEGDLLIVPLEELWGVPWPAVASPAGGMLGEAHAITIAPSLTLAASPGAEQATVSAVAAWRSPLVAAVAVHAFDDDIRVALTRIETASGAKDALLAGGADLLAIVAHGVPAAGMRHFLELDQDVYVTPVDLMTADVPPRVALIACWGAHTPDSPGGEPLTLAALAAARGAEVLCTVSELADDPLASRFVNSVLHRSIEQPFPEAVRDATRQFLADPFRRDGLLSRWAPIVTVGRTGGAG